MTYLHLCAICLNIYLASLMRDESRALFALLWSVGLLAAAYYEFI